MQSFLNVHIVFEQNDARIWTRRHCALHFNRENPGEQAKLPILFCHSFGSSFGPCRSQLTRSPEAHLYSNCSWPWCKRAELQPKQRLKTKAIDTLRTEDTYRRYLRNYMMNSHFERDLSQGCTYHNKVFIMATKCFGEVRLVKFMKLSYRRDFLL